jgi:hypothetical protein
LSATVRDKACNRSHQHSASCTSRRHGHKSRPHFPKSSVEYCGEAHTARGDLSSGRSPLASLLPHLGLGHEHPHHSCNSLGTRHDDEAACIPHNNTPRHHADVPLLPRTLRMPCSAADESGQHEARARSSISASHSSSWWAAVATSKTTSQPASSCRLPSSASTTLRRLTRQQAYVLHDGCADRRWRCRHSGVAA